MAKNFGNRYYYRIIHDITSEYDDIVAKLERENLYPKTEQQYLEEEKQERIQEQREGFAKRAQELDDAIESNKENNPYSDVNSESQVSIVSD